LNKAIYLTRRSKDENSTSELVIVFLFHRASHTKKRQTWSDFAVACSSSSLPFSEHEAIWLFVAAMLNRTHSFSNKNLFPTAQDKKGTKAVTRFHTLGYGHDVQIISSE
jgi:hypothetical protein